MTKVVLNSALSTYDVGIINANFAKIQTELQDKVLYRDNPVGEPNTLETDVNANNKRIYNLPEPTTSGEPLRLEDLENVAGNLQDSLDAATEAAASAAAASVSAASALSSASNAASSATSADASELAAANSAASAAGSADTATQQAVLSTAYSNVAGAHAGAASSSAFDADASSNGANASAIAAGNSATDAAASAVSAAASAASAAGAVSGHISDPTDAHAATAITNTPAGGIGATTVQAAINELDTEKAPLASPTFTGQASFPAGSAAAPSVKVGSAQHGLYEISSTSLGLAMQGCPALQLTGSATATNYFLISAQAAGTAPIFLTGGADSNISQRFRTKGIGVFLVETGSSGNEQFRVNHVASAVNRVQVAGSATGTPVTVSVGGSDTNVYFNYYTKGNGAHQFLTGGGLQAVVGDAVSAVNYWMLTGAATGGLPTFTVQGSNTNISAYMATKGTGSWRFATGGGDQFRIVNVPNAVNYWSAYGAATGNGPFFYADGSDAAINANYSLKGSGSHVFYTGSTSLVQMVIGHVASAVNWPVISGSATGNAVTISTNGSDANRSITATAGGAGAINLGNATNGTVAALGTFASAEKAIYILNTTTAPTANPATGGYLYCEGGALKYRGSSGTITTIAAA